MVGIKLRKLPFNGRAWMSAMATIASLTVAVGLTAQPPAAATLDGSSFNALDKTPDAGAYSYTDPTGNADVSNFSNGSKEDDICPGVATGTASPKDDLDKFYYGSDAPDHVFLYLGWHRISVTGTTTVDFELNQSNLAAPSCSNGLSKMRTAGDILLTYDFQGTGPFTLDTSMREWIGTATSGHWGATHDLSNFESEASISDDGQFGEMVVDLNAAGIFQTDVCKDFGTVFSKTRSSSSSFTSAIKDFTAPVPTLVSNCGHVTAHKVDDAGSPLSGVTFTLYTDVNGSLGVPVSPAKSCTTDGTGDCTLTDIKAGTYWLVESGVPAGYTQASPQRVTVAVSGNTPANPLTFVDPRQPAQVNIIKHDDTGTNLAGATFGLYTDDSGATGDAVSGKTCTTGSGGTCSITNILPPGTYWVVETAVPTGYTGADPQSVTLALNQTVTLTFSNDRIPARVDITKHDDAGALLAGATFGLYTNNDGARGSAVSGKSCTTNASGACSITNILPAGSYWVHETVVPSGYAAADDQLATVSLNQTVTLTFVDPRNPARLDIVKHDDTGAPLAGATFALYTDNDGARGTAIAGKTCTTSAAGTCSITGILPPATYWVHETVVPFGYFAAADQKMTLGLNQVMQITFVDERKPISIELDKQVNGQDPTENDPLVVEGGSTVHYTVTITNTGQLPLTISSATDSLYGDFATCANNVTIETGHSLTCTYSAAVNTLAHNVASVTAHDFLQRTVSANDDTWVKPIHPDIAVTKTGPSAAHVGDSTTYMFHVTNPGDTGLSNVTISDSKCASAPVLQSKTGGNDDNMLEPGEDWTYSCSRTVTAGDGDSVLNVVTVHGTDMLETTVSASASHELEVLHPAISIAKTANPTSVSGSGIVTYTYVVTNTGDTQLTNVTVNDDILGAIGIIAVLNPGQSVTLTKQTFVTTTSPTTNIGTATGTDRLGKQISANAKASITVVLAAVITQLPRTGGSILVETMTAAVLFGAGLLLVTTSRRRRRRTATV